jgi:hypothetical protein
MPEYITFAGLIMLLTQGTITFFLMRFAHKVVEDPDYEERIFKKHKNK